MNISNRSVPENHPRQQKLVCTYYRIANIHVIIYYFNAPRPTDYCMYLNHTSISRRDVIGVTMPKFDPSVHHLDSIVQNYYKLVNKLIIKLVGRYQNYLWFENVIQPTGRNTSRLQFGGGIHYYIICTLLLINSHNNQ